MVFALFPAVQILMPYIASKTVARAIYMIACKIALCLHSNAKAWLTVPLSSFLIQLCRMAFLTSSRMRRRLNISSFVQSASSSPIFSFATAYVPGVFARRIQSVATSSASAMRMSVDNPGVFLPSSMFDRCTTEMSAFSASSPCVSLTSRRRSAMRLPMAEGLQFLFIAFHPFADNANGDCTSGFVPGNTVSVLFICLAATYSFVVIRAMCAPPL